MAWRAMEMRKASMASPSWTSTVFFRVSVSTRVLPRKLMRLICFCSVTMKVTITPLAVVWAERCPTQPSNRDAKTIARKLARENPSTGGRKCSGGRSYVKNANGSRDECLLFPPAQVTLHHAARQLAAARVEGDALGEL